MVWNEVSAVFHLPCGCVLRRSFHIEVPGGEMDPNRQPENFGYQLSLATGKLDHWLQGAAFMHDCDRVTEDNPHGLPRVS